MKLLYFHRDKQVFLGVSTPAGVVDIDAYRQAGKLGPVSSWGLSDELVAVVHHALSDAQGIKSFLLPEATLSIASCVATPSKIICIGLNYRRHALESNMPVPTVPVVFTKYNNTLVDYGADIALGKVGREFDYEVELGFVIGRRCKDATKETALSFVLGYCVANDLSCRDLQFRTSQWLMGKSLDHFLPLGKYLVTADEISDPQTLRLQCFVNDAPRQDSNTSDMIFTVAEIIEDLSRHMTLEPGDLIITGTPEGVIMGMKEKNWLKPGDKVCVEIEKIGSACNKMA